MLQEKEEAGSYKLLGSYDNFRCPFVAFVLEELGALKKQYAVVIQSLVCIGRRDVRVPMSNCICYSPGSSPSYWPRQGTVSTNWHWPLPVFLQA